MKKIWLTFLACLTFLCLTFATACSINQKPQLAFNEGYLEEVVLGDPIMLDEYIDPEFTSDYTAILTCDETGKERDLKTLGQWTTDKPGTYTLTYTVNSGEYKGTITTKITVVVPEVEWQYSRPTLVYRAGDTMEFNLLKRNLNLLVKSYYDYTFYVKSVMVNEKKIDVSDQTSYTFAEEGEHVVTFAIKTEDGQELFADQVISVRPQQILAPGAAEWMEENNITSHDYTYIAPDGTVKLDAGYYNNSFLDDNVPYLAFNGAEGSDGFGLNTYVMVDFTGKNLPQVAFFCDEVTPSFTDGKNGIYFQNATTLNDGSVWSELDASRLTIFGPRKSSYAEFDNKGRMLALGSVADPCPMSYNALQENDSYRYIIGITEGSTNSITARILLINMTTLERVFDFTQRITTYSSPSGNVPLGLSDDYFKGSIVLYGKYGVKIELDKVYAPITGIDDIYELDVAAAFKSNYKTQYELNAVANISDFIDVPTNYYEFTVLDSDGEEVKLAEDGSFAFSKSGDYRLIYNPHISGVRASSITIRVMYDVRGEIPADYFEKEGAIMTVGNAGLKTNVNKDYIKEGSQSIEYYTVNGTDGKGLNVYISKSFMDFIFLSRAVQGITFDVYSAKALDFKLNDEGRTDKLLMDYTGSIPAETWTTITISYELCIRNDEVYKDKGYKLALNFYGQELAPRECIYIDNIQLILSEETIAKEAQAFMDANNIKAYGFHSISSDLQVSLQEGRYAKEWWNLEQDSVPYIAYEGNFDAGSYVVVDFTGKNVPQLTFFAKEITSSLIDGKAGLYIHTGMVKKNGLLVSDTDGGRLTFLGPNKIEYCRPDSTGRVGKQFGTKGWYPDGTRDDAGTAVSPLSLRGLEDGVHYRLVAGIKTAREESVTKGRIVLELLLINLDTNTEVVMYEWSEATEGLHSLLGGGNIVMYGRYNQAITIDKLYAVHQNVSNIYAIAEVTEVLSSV